MNPKSPSNRRSRRLPHVLVILVLGVMPVTSGCGLLGAGAGLAGATDGLVEGFGGGAEIGGFVPGRLEAAVPADLRKGVGTAEVGNPGAATPAAAPDAGEDMGRGDPVA